MNLACGDEVNKIKIAFHLKWTMAVLFCAPMFLLGQRWEQNNFGVRCGLTYQFGSHQDRIGSQIGVYFLQEYFQINASAGYTFNFKDWGNEKNTHVTQLVIGGFGLFGEKRLLQNPFILVNYHQSERQFVLGYLHHFYFTSNGTNQRTGSLNLHFDHLSLLVENDFLAGQGKDRYRTSFVGVHYRQGQTVYQLENLLWTGETAGALQFESSTKEMPKGWKDLANNHLGTTSHGILRMGVMHYMGWGNHWQVQLGWDSELIRHQIQNKWMHNKNFIPKVWRSPNRHFPMLDEDGKPVFEAKARKPDRFYFSGSWNGWLGY